MATPKQDPTTGKFVSTDAAKTAAADKPTIDPPGKPGEKPDTSALDGMLKNYLSKDEPVKTEEEIKAEEEAAKKAKEKEDADKAKAAAKPPVKPAPKKPVSTRTEDVLAKTAATLDEVTKRLNQPAKEAPKEPQKEEIAPSLKRTYDVLKRMEGDFSDKYKGIADKWLEGTKKLAAYKAEWESKHPGETFDDEADEHESFYAAHDVNWDDDDYTESFANLKVDQKVAAKVEEQTKAQNERLTTLEREAKRRDATANIQNEGITASRSYWGQMGDEFKDLLKPDGSVDREAYDKLKAADPVGMNLRTQAALKVHDLASTMHELINGYTPYDDKNPKHQHLVNFAITQEKEMMKQADSERADAQGRTFLPRKQYRQLSAEQKENHWTFSAADIGFMLAQVESNAIRKHIEAKEEEFRQIAEARGIKLPPKGEKGAKAAPSVSNVPGKSLEELEEEQAQIDDEKPLTPSTSLAPKAAAAKPGAGAGSLEPLQAFFKKQIAKS